MSTIALHEIDDLLENLGEIPTLPSIATAIMGKTLDENINARQIAEMVEMDQSLAVKVLKVANSPFYRRIKEISTIRGAVVLLGLNVLKSIVLSISVVNLFNDKENRALDLYRFWQHSIACAVCAREIANKVHPASAEDAFMAGLIHDLGKVVADRFLCPKGEYAEVLGALGKSRKDIIQIEHEAIGVDHAVIGQHLMEKWNLPQILCRSVGGHHNLTDAIEDPETKRLCAIVHVADMITNHLGLGITEVPAGFIEPALLKQLELSSHDIQEISIALKDSISTISEQLGIPKAEPKTYFEVLQSANSQLGRLSLDLEQKKLALERRAMELSSINQMSSQLQSCMKLSEITNIITSHSLNMLEARKTRCLIRLNQLRVMITESFQVSNSVQTRTGVSGATKEILDRTSGIYPKKTPYLYAPIRVEDKIIGVIEAIHDEGELPEDSNQRCLLLRTIAEIGAQAIQRATLVTKNIKAQRLAAVTKTAIAANHEINSPLTTILLKLDMLSKEPGLAASHVGTLKEIKGEAMKINMLVKKMLEISDVVETTYTQDEKMLDIHKASEKRPEPQSAPPTVKETPAPAAPAEDLPGFEDYLDE